jgi:hypothetical protein
MTDPADIPIAESLILARLLPSGEKGETAAKIATDLKPLLGDAAIAGPLADLKSRGLVADLPAKGKSKKPTGKFLLTDDGRSSALGFLGVDALPPGTKWPAIRKSYLTLRALGVPTTAETLKKLGSDAGLKPALLGRLYALPIGDTPTTTQATDALTWKLLGLDSAERLSVAAIQKALFHRALGDPGGKPIDPKKAVDHLVAKGLGTSSADARKFRDAALLKWIGDAGRARAAPPSPGDSAAPLPLPFNLEIADFAERVKAAAAACETGRFGDNKVFVVHVWRMLKETPEFAGRDFPAFKAKLAEANNLRLLDLARADLVPAMNPEDVGLSEIQHLGATFHFVRI